MKSKTLILFLSVLLIAIQSNSGYSQAKFLCDSSINVCPNTVDFLIKHDIQLKQYEIENDLLSKQIEEYKIALNSSDSIQAMQLHSSILNNVALSICEGKDAMKNVIMLHQEKLIARKSVIEIILGTIATGLIINYAINR
ncbi:MAG: hypothetical protein V4549_17965 [Bacteroidota bacterium]